MKKFKYAIGIAAMAMFGACSSDAPEIIDNNPEEGSDAKMYLSLNITGSTGTRAQTTAQTETSGVENTIKNLLIQIYDEAENLVLCKKTTDFSDDKTVAYFEVDYNQYQNVKTLFNNTDNDPNKNPRIIVVANSKESYSLSTPVIHDDYTDPTWGIQTGDGINKIGNSPCFIMTNMAECHAIAAPATGHDGTDKEKSWKLTTTAIPIGRMATRFEYGTDNKDSYTLESNSGMTMEIVGMKIETFGVSTLYIPTFTADGKVPEDFSVANSHVHYSGKEAFPYRATAVKTSDERAEYQSLDYSYLNSANKFTYAHPNTISKAYTLKKSVDDYKALPNAAIKVKFNCTNFAGTGAVSESMKKGDNVYAVNGVFIGGVKDYIKLKKANKTFAISNSYADGSDEYTKVKAVVDLYNGLNYSLMPSQKDGKTEGGTEDDAWFKKQFPNVDTYAPEYAEGESKATTADGAHKYYTYYAKFITHFTDPSDVLVQDWMKDKSGNILPQWMYGVSRNTSYALAVNSIRFMGATGDKGVGDGPTASDISTLWIDLSITIKPWDVNVSNTAWDL
ncbi:MAG: fimbria major subunit [Muribaculaceae bacterium]|nr:fimbria major subunit [Muribaculaceae bacterium]